ncbi:hypothetical protein C8P67_114136 [Flavobacterium aquicola]|uniref:Uncharacterized protein n=1 Tax=Flavobacterium aquicola TaxID=1682742 RepID=A0A3E0E408_9FLAO|nr:hypothetical protein C8P67_114136 [Flavobacterium aquicola]
MKSSLYWGLFFDYYYLITSVNLGFYNKTVPLLNYLECQNNYFALNKSNHNEKRNITI